MQIFENTKQYFNRYFDIKAYRTSIENKCDPRYLQGSYSLLLQAKVDVLSYISYTNQKYIKLTERKF